MNDTGWIGINERIAGMMEDRPERSGMFASVPLPDVDGSLEAIAYAYDQLSTDGIVLLASPQGIHLGDPKLEPFMEELDRRSAIVLVHPAHLEGQPVAGLHPSLADFLLDWPGRVLFGSDSPYASGETIGHFTGDLDDYEGLDAAAHAAINRSNADVLFPRLAARRP